AARVAHLSARAGAAGAAASVAAALLAGAARRARDLRVRVDPGRAEVDARHASVGRAIFLAERRDADDRLDAAEHLERRTTRASLARRVAGLADVDDAGLVAREDRGELTFRSAAGLRGAVAHAVADDAHRGAVEARVHRRVAVRDRRHADDRSREGEDRAVV